LYQSSQFKTAEETALRAFDLFPNQGEQYHVCVCHRLLGSVYRVNGKGEEATSHFEAALDIATQFDWHDQLFWNHYNLVQLSLDESRFDDAQSHIEHAKLHVIDNEYYLGRVTELQAMLWNGQERYREAKSEVLRAIEIYGKLGATRDLEDCRGLLQRIECHGTCDS